MVSGWLKGDGNSVWVGSVVVKEAVMVWGLLCVKSREFRSLHGTVVDVAELGAAVTGKDHRRGKETLVLEKNQHRLRVEPWAAGQGKAGQGTIF